MLTYNTFVRSKDGKLTMNEVKEQPVDYGESITDKSHYNPNASSFVSNSGSINSTPLYDFNDGVDNGIKYSLFRDKSLDITEQEYIYNKLKLATSEQLKELADSIELESDLSDDNKTIDIKTKTESSDTK